MRRYTTSRSVMTVLLTAALLLSTLGVSYAGSKGRKNTALALTGATVYSLLKGNTDTALILGAGAAYAWKKYDDKRDEERARESFLRSERRAQRRDVWRTGGRRWR